MKTQNLFFLIILIITTVSCSKEITNQVANPLPNRSQLNAYCSNVNLSEEDAKAVASIYARISTTKARATKTIEDVIAIKDERDKVVMYAINYTDNDGYMLVSATKKFYPILAEVECGHFSENGDSTGASILLEEYKKRIEYCQTMPDDSLSKFRALWSKYEERPTFNSQSHQSRSGDEEFSHFVGSTVAQWINQGYEVFPLSEDPLHIGLPVSVYNQWYNIAQQEAHPNYDFEENSFILRITSSYNNTYGPYLTTKWGQRSPYNNSIPNHYPVGCCAVAYGQVMKYHEWPTTFQWSDMPDEMDDNNVTTVLPNYLYEIGLSCDMDYSSGGSGASFNSVVNALKNQYDYSDSCSIISHNMNLVRNNIISGFPVIMGGFPQYGQGHAWVCDGYYDMGTSETYRLEIISTYHQPLQYISPCSDYSNGLWQKKFHMNFGDRGINNGWYLEGEWPENEEYNNYRMDIINIKPNRNRQDL